MPMKRLHLVLQPHSLAPQLVLLARHRPPQTLLSMGPSRPTLPLEDDKAAKSNAPQSDSPEAPHSDDPVFAAMQARVEVLEAELIRLTDLAQQLHRDVREARAAIQSRSPLHQ